MVYIHCMHHTYTVGIVGFCDGAQTFIVSYKRMRGLPHICVHTPSLSVGRPSRGGCIPSRRAVSVHTPSPSVAITSDRLYSSVSGSERLYV